MLLKTMGAWQMKHGGKIKHGWQKDFLKISQKVDEN
jgi:hypothetical protein